jgi:hypothetical protein
MGNRSILDEEIGLTKTMLARLRGQNQISTVSSECARRSIRSETSRAEASLTDLARVERPLLAIEVELSVAILPASVVKLGRDPARG